MKKYFKIINILIFSSAIFLPNVVFGAKIFLDTSDANLYVGDTAVINVRIDTEGKNINTVEGNISLVYPIKSISVGDLSLSGSSFSLWPRKPSLSLNGKDISFVGGVPGGVNSKNAIIFKIVLNLEESGQIQLVPKNISVYINDGKGTKDMVTNNNLTFNILGKQPNSPLKDSWSTDLLKDKTPPEPFTILLGQEGSVFDGKKFISFSTTDKQSDVEYYEVKEGSLPAIRTGNTYVLQNQNKIQKITVLAYDSAGNVRKEVYNESSKIPYYIIIAVLLFWFLKKKKWIR